MSLCVGLTGGIASGKSTAGKLFQALGVPLIDADQAARDVVEPGSPGLAAVAAEFGTEVLQADGSLNRRLLREKVFKDDEQRKTLESILHPLIRRQLQDWREALSAPYGLLMSPIMRESGFIHMVDRVLVVDVSRETQKSRLMSRDGIDDALAESMLNAQDDRASRLAIADDVIDNSDEPGALDAQVQRLHKQYLALAAAADI